MSVSIGGGVSHSFVEPDIHRGTTAPPNGRLGDLWEDTSGSPPVLKHCTNESPVTWDPVDTGGGGGTITVQDEGVTQSTTVTTLDFVGAGVVASGGGATATITISGGGSSTKVAGITLDGGGAAITTGTKGYIVLPFSGTIDQWFVVADQTGSIVIDVWKTASPTIPTNANTITGTEKPTLSSAQFNSDTALSTWTTTVTAGDILGFEVESVATVQRVTLTIRIS